MDDLERKRRPAGKPDGAVSQVGGETSNEYNGGELAATDQVEANMAATLHSLELLVRSAPILDSETHYHATLLIEVEKLIRHAARDLAADRRRWRRRALPLRRAAA